jgi:hypothetical protein
MLKSFFEELTSGLIKELDEINLNEELNLIERFNSALREVSGALKQAKAVVVSNHFNSDAEEICCFKELKPRLYAEKIYQVHLFNLLNSKPIQLKEDLIAYYREELNFIKRFFQHHLYYYQYFRNGNTELDNLLFLRNSSLQTILLPDVPELDPEFSTNGDYIFAKFIAYERVQEYLVKEILRLETGIEPTSVPSWVSELTWTGEKINFVEVAYGWYFTAQLNHGNVDLADIIRWAAIALNVDISRAYRDFTDLSRRKTTSPTRYLDRMRESIHNRIDEDNAFQPKSGKDIRGTS